MQMTVQEVLNDRLHKYDEAIKASCEPEFKGYMKGWHDAYRDILEIMEQNDFNTNQVLIDTIKREEIAKKKAKQNKGKIIKLELDREETI